MDVRPYYIHAYDPKTGDIVVNLGRTLYSSNADEALQLAEQLAGMYPSHRFIVSNDRGRNLGSFEGDDFTYLGY